jgi:hypothetical protein
MFRQRSVDRRLHWGLLLALVLATLAPSVAHALRHLRGDTMPWSQLCSATGGKRVVFASQAGDPGSTPRAHAFEHCSFCALLDGPWAPPPSAGAIAPRAGPFAIAPAPHPLRAPGPLAWRLAQPRAPPVLTFS